MPGGLFGTGLSYEGTALSGLSLESQEQQQEDQANAQIKAQKQAQEDQMLGSIAGTGLGIASYFIMSALLTP